MKNIIKNLFKRNKTNLIRPYLKKLLL